MSDYCRRPVVRPTGPSRTKRERTKGRKVTRKLYGSIVDDLHPLFPDRLLSTEVDTVSTRSRLLTGRSTLFLSPQSLRFCPSSPFPFVFTAPQPPSPFRLPLLSDLKNCSKSWSLNSLEYLYNSTYYAETDFIPVNQKNPRD